MDAAPLPTDAQQLHKVAIIDSELFDLHIPDGGLPERPDRTRVIRKALKEIDLPATWLKPIRASADDIDRLPHSKNYIEHVQTVGRKAAEHKGLPMFVSADAEVLMSEHSLEAVECAVGAALQAVRLVVSAESPVQRVFCNTRPPGHHAHAKKGQGFCIYNNVWAAACEARRLGCQRVAIVDWDVHHGNGTQDFVLHSGDDEKDTLFFSIHQHHTTIWPGTGKEATHGNHGTVNCHNLQPGAADEDMQQYFQAVLMPKITDFKPDIILISCGFDGHCRDPIGGLAYTTKLYGWMTERLVDAAESMESCKGRIISILEGGYDLIALQESSVEHVAALIGTLAAKARLERRDNLREQAWLRDQIESFTKRLEQLERNLNAMSLN